VISALDRPRIRGIQAGSLGGSPAFIAGADKSGDDRPPGRPAGRGPFLATLKFEGARAELASPPIHSMESGPLQEEEHGEKGALQIFEEEAAGYVTRRGSGRHPWRSNVLHQGDRGANHSGGAFPFSESSGVVFPRSLGI